MRVLVSVKLMKQGVRDLSHLPGKSKGYRLPEPPRQMQRRCRHLHTEECQVGYTIYEKCVDCGTYVDQYE